MPAPRRSTLRSPASSAVKFPAEILRTGEQLPAIEELCTRYGVSQVTMRQAIQILTAEGLVVSQRGRRVTVTGSPKITFDNTLGEILGVMAELGPYHEIRVVERSDDVPLPRGSALSERKRRRTRKSSRCIVWKAYRTS